MVLGIKIFEKEMTILNKKLVSTKNENSHIQMFQNPRIRKVLEAQLYIDF